jgi:hypothetical protein
MQDNKANSIMKKGYQYDPLFIIFFIVGIIGSIITKVKLKHGIVISCTPMGLALHSFPQRGH